MDQEVKKKLLKELMEMTGQMDGDRIQKPMPMGAMPGGMEEEEPDQDIDPRLLELLKKKRGIPTSVGSARG